jgi:membrane-associated protease RseP (regulator of RpoE activity)
MADLMQTFWQDQVLGWIWPLVQFFIGLNLVVFVHEMGHFLAARWAGIKVERFALGMGPRLIGFQKGETDYCICALPLGGYVKMHGQEDFGATEQTEADPRSYQSKTVGQRFVVIAAGVVMNVILGIVLFTILGMTGKQFTAPVVGSVTPNFPADRAVVTWQAQAPPAEPRYGYDQQAEQWLGLRPGDRITKIKGGGFFVRLLGEDINRFEDIFLKSVLAGQQESLEVEFQRPVGEQSFLGTTTMGVRMSPQLGAPVFGIAQPMTRTIGDAGDPDQTPFQSGDVIVAVNGDPIDHAWQLPRAMESLGPAPVMVTVQRKQASPQKQNAPPATQPATAPADRITFTLTPTVSNRSVVYTRDGERIDGVVLVSVPEGGKPTTVIGSDWQRVSVPSGHLAVETDGAIRILPREQVAGGTEESLLDVLGLMPRAVVEMVIPGSPAEQAGLQPGDIILRYADQPLPTHGRFLDISRRVGEQETSITILRDGQEQTLSITPRKRETGVMIGIVQSLDLAHLVVADVRQGSPAGRAGLPPEATITTVNGQAVETWLDLLARLEELKQSAPDAPIVLGTRLGRLDQEYTLPALSETSFAPEQYQYAILTSVSFLPRMTEMKLSFLQAVPWGLRESYRFLVTGYGQIQAMLAGRISAKGVRGPVGIGQAAITAAKHGLSQLVYLVALLSTLIAVFNFLPLPVLDGGHAVLLLIEKIRGKPLPVKVVNIIQTVGLVLILGLFLLITFHDILRIFSERW